VGRWGGGVGKMRTERVKDPRAHPTFLEGKKVE